VCPTHIEVDGNQLPKIADLQLGCKVRAIIGGDATRSAISAASILAKVTRDTMMERMDAHYPGFNFSSHRGYSTPEHLAALEYVKPCYLHRRTFAPVAEQLGETEMERRAKLLEGTGLLDETGSRATAVAPKSRAVVLRAPARGARKISLEVSSTAKPRKRVK